jgi:endo-1,4-beta-xylanase
VVQDEKGNPLDRETLLNRLRDHIFTVVGRYKGRIKGWDVVNEALNQDGTMRESPWMKIIGEDYLVRAFEFAREADPSAELYYNDYDLELPAKRAGAVELITKLKAAGVKISGVGLQNHSLMEWPSATDEDATIGAFSTLGMKVHITELDVDVLPRTTKPGADYAVDDPVTPQLNPYVDRLPDAVQLALARRYAELFRVYLKHRDAIERVTFWGVTDRDSWLNNWPMKGRTNYPLLFDRSGRAKTALAAVIRTRSPGLSGDLKWPAQLTAEQDHLSVDSHELIALCAPRPAFIGAGDKGDEWVAQGECSWRLPRPVPYTNFWAKEILGLISFPRSKQR